MKKRFLLIILSICLVTALITGCGKTDESGKGNVQKESNKTEKPSLVIPVSATVTTLNGILETMAEGAMQLAPFYDELYYVDGNETRYYLAENCEVSEDGLVYTLKLKNNLKWHDGEAITADDIIFTTSCSANTSNGAGFTNIVFLEEKEIKIEKVDELTVTFTLPEPSASYFEILGHLILIPEHAFKGNTDIISAEANLTDIGSGPYKLVEFKNGESLALEKFEGYYGDAPKIDKVIFTVISDPSAQEVAFRNGDINFLAASSDVSAKEIENIDGAELHTLPEGRVKYLAWNKYSKTWAEQDAVKAVFYALNQEEIVQGAYGENMGVGANTIFSRRNIFYNDSIEGYKQDIEVAKDLAQKSGLAGKTIKLHYNIDRSYMEDTALLIQEQLKVIDVKVEVEGISANGFFDVTFSDKDNYELYLNEYGAIGDPDTVISGMYNGTWGVNVNTSDEILDLFIKGRNTADMEKRASIYSEIQQRAKDEFLVYPIAYPNYVFLTNSNLKGTEVYDTTPIFEDYTKIYFE